MEYTFGQAKKILRNAAYLHGTVGVGEQISNAVMALAGLNGWEFLRKLVRTFSVSPVFSLPQGTADLVRVCVNGHPASLHGTDYQFLHSGPGDLEGYIRHGFNPLRSADVADLGFSPVMTSIPEPVFVCAVSPYVTASKGSDGTRPQAPITVTGLDTVGERVVKKVSVIQGSIDAFPAYSSFSSYSFASIESVVLDNAADEYITLYGMTAHGSMLVLGHYHPSVKVPKFHQYRIADSVKGPYDILAEVRVDPLPFVSDDDVIPLPSLEPVKHMMLYDANLAMNELTTAQQYMQQAVQWLSQMQQADHMVQTPVVQNVLFDGSNGDMTMEYLNL